MSLGLVNPRSVIEGDLTITDVSRRNSVFVATTSTGPTHVVKQAGPGSVDTLRREAEVLRALAGHAPLSGSIPELMHRDDAGARVVLRSPGHLTAWGSRRPSRRAAREFGRLLAAVHASRPAIGRELPGVDPLWALTLPDPPHAQLRTLSSGALGLLELIQGSRLLCRRLEEVREAIDRSAFVHGDLRWDNCLAAPRTARRVVLIDWELAGRGDPASDLGAALAEYLRVSLLSIPIVDRTDHGRHVGDAREPLSALAPMMRELLAGYRSVASHPVALRRVTEFAAVRLVQTAVEYAQGLGEPTAQLGAIVEFSAGMLDDPELAAFGLFGLRE